MKDRNNQPGSRKLEVNGSSMPGEPLFLAVGKLRRPHGLGGEILMEILTDFPERLRKNKIVFIGKKYEPHKIQSIRTHNQNLLIRLEGYDTRDQIGLLRNQYMYIKAQGLPELPEGEYYHHQLLGMKVKNEEGIFLGKLIDILETGVNDVYVVKNDEGKELLLPAIEDVILKVDPSLGEMIVQPPVWYND